MAYIRNQGRQAQESDGSYLLFLDLLFLSGIRRYVCTADRRTA